MPAPSDSPTRAHCLPVGVLHSFLPHPIHLGRRASQLFPPLTSARSGRRQQRPGSRTEERNPLPALPSPPPAPKDGLRHWGAAGDRFFLQPGLRGRGHSAAFGNRGCRLLGEISALGNRDAPEPRAAPSPSLHGFPSPPRCIPGIVVPSMPAGAGSARSWTTSPRIPQGQRGTVERLLPASAVPAVLPLSRRRHTKGDGLSAPCVPPLTEAAAGMCVYL